MRAKFLRPSVFLCPGSARASSRLRRRSLLGVLVARPGLSVASLLMRRHTASEAAGACAVEDQKQRLSVPPPDEWEFDERGRPRWIGAGGEWAVVANRSRIEHVELPQGWKQEAEVHVSAGRPRLEVREPKKLLHAAWRKDCVGDTYLEVARDLGFRIDRLANSEDVAKTRATRYVRRGRAFACALGIWPWVCWPKGVPAQRSWWLDQRCRTWLLLWQEQSLRQAALRPAIKIELLIRSALEREKLAAFELGERVRKQFVRGVID
jgi:hypothetical protein